VSHSSQNQKKKGRGFHQKNVKVQNSLQDLGKGRNCITYFSSGWPQLKEKIEKSISFSEKEQAGVRKKNQDSQSHRRPHAGEK